MRSLTKLLFALLATICLAACSSSGKATPTPITALRGPAVVPDVVGMRVCDALPVLVTAGVIPDATPNAEITWIVVAQRPKPGRRVRWKSFEDLRLKPDSTP